MGSYNLKVYEYTDSVQLRLYNQSLTYDEKVSSVPLIEPVEPMKKVHTSELSEERKEKSALSSMSRTVSSIYEISRANTWDYFVTFTFNRNLIDSSDYDLLSSKVSIWLNNLKKRYAPDLKYLIVPELHKDGIHYHFHAVIANVGNIRFVDSGVKKKGHIIYNLDNWKFGFTTASKVLDSGRISSYITKYITKDLCAVSKNKKRFWCSRNCDRAKVRTYNISYEKISEFLDENIELLRHTSSISVDSCGLEVTYIEMAKGEKDECGEITKVKK